LNDANINNFRPQILQVGLGSVRLTSGAQYAVHTALLREL